MIPRQVFTLPQKKQLVAMAASSVRRGRELGAFSNAEAGVLFAVLIALNRSSAKDNLVSFAYINVMDLAPSLSLTPVAPTIRDLLSPDFYGSTTSAISSLTSNDLLAFGTKEEILDPRYDLFAQDDGLYLCNEVDEWWYAIALARLAKMQITATSRQTYALDR